MKTLTFTTMFLLFFAVVLCYAQECGEPIPTGVAECEESNIPIDVAPIILPVFQLKKPTVNPSDVTQLSREILDSPGFDFEVKQERDSLNVKVRSSIIEVYKRTGGIWFADKSQLWNPRLTPKLPSYPRAKTQAEGLFKKIYLQKRRSRYLDTSFANFGKTLLSKYEIQTLKRTDKQLDVQVNFVTRVKPFPGEKLILPVVGGGGEFNFTFGDQNKLIGHSGVWRDIEKKVRDYPVLSKAESDKRFSEIMKKPDLDFSSYLAYYLAPSFKEQEFLYPVYVYHYSISIDNEKTAFKIVVLPATSFRPPEPPRPLYVESRSDDDLATIRPGSTAAEEDDKAEGEHEVGVSWIDDEVLNNTGKNATDFLTALTSAGWVENFSWGDGNAWERDWHDNDDLWVDAADIVFYAGHASLDHWVLKYPYNTKLRSSFVGSDPESPGDLWGNQDLEWIIINACGPLEDECLNVGGGNVFTRWKGVFDGLHQLLGYGSTVYDWGLEGGKVAEYMLNGDPIIDSWFRAAREVQGTCNDASPPYGKKSYVGVLYAEEENAAPSTRYDHLWGKGSVSADPETPNFIIAMWTST